MSKESKRAMDINGYVIIAKGRKIIKKWKDGKKELITTIPESWDDNEWKDYFNKINK